MTTTLRRLLMATLFSLVLVLSACGSAKKPITIALLSIKSPANQSLDPFLKQALAEKGYTDVNYVTMIDVAAADLPTAVSKIFDAKPDVVVTSTTAAAKAVIDAAKGRNDAPPLVFNVNNAILSGLTDKVGRDRNQPGITGVNTGGASDGKRLEWFAKMLPNAKTFYMPFNAKDPGSLESAQEGKQAAQALGVSLITRECTTQDEVVKCASYIPDGVDGIYLPSDTLQLANLPLYLAAAFPLHLPVAATQSLQVANGALMGYGFEFKSVGYQMARMVDQVLKGVKVGDIPLENAEYILSVNTAAAQKLGITIPKEILNTSGLIIMKDLPALASAPTAVPTAAATSTH